MLLQCMMGHVVHTFVSLLQAVQVQLVARLFAGVLLKRSEGLCGVLDSSPCSQRLLLEAGGGRTARSRGPCWPQGTMGVCGGRSGGGHVGGVAEVAQSLSVFRPQQLHDWTGTWSRFRTTRVSFLSIRSNQWSVQRSDTYLIKMWPISTLLHFPTVLSWNRTSYSIFSELGIKH